MAKKNPGFSDFCRAQGLSDDTITQLQADGFNSQEDLCLLQGKELEKTLEALKLRKDKLLLKNVVQKLIEKSALTRVMREKADEKPTDDEIRIVLFGVTGSGKSTTGNTILGTDLYCDLFKESATGVMIDATTKLTQRRSIKINGRNIRVVDTPGLQDTSRDQEEVMNEVSRFLLTNSPGPHALFFVLNIDARFTRQEFAVYDKLRKFFSSSLNRYVVVVFTHGDKLPEGKTLDAVLKSKAPPTTDEGSQKREILQTILDDFGDRTILLNNKGDQATKDQQVLKLLRLISAMKEDNAPNPFFSDKETLKTTEHMRSVFEDYMKKNPGISRKDAWEKVNEMEEQVRNKDGPEGKTIPAKKCLIM